MKTAILLITSVFIFFLISTNAKGAESFNSSRSNLSSIVVPSDVIDQSKLDQILADIDKIGADITKRQVHRILAKLKIKGIKKIVISKRKGKLEVLLLDNPAHLSAAKKVVKFKAGTAGISPARIKNGGGNSQKATKKEHKIKTKVKIN